MSHSEIFDLRSDEGAKNRKKFQSGDSMKEEIESGEMSSNQEREKRNIELRAPKFLSVSPVKDELKPNIEKDYSSLQDAADEEDDQMRKPENDFNFA